MPEELDADVTVTGGEPATEDEGEVKVPASEDPDREAPSDDDDDDGGGSGGGSGGGDDGGGGDADFSKSISENIEEGNLEPTKLTDVEGEDGFRLTQDQLSERVATGDTEDLSPAGAGGGSIDPETKRETATREQEKQIDTALEKAALPESARREGDVALTDVRTSEGRNLTAEQLQQRVREGRVQDLRRAPTNPDIGTVQPRAAQRRRETGRQDFTGAANQTQIDTAIQQEQAFGPPSTLTQEQVETLQQTRGPIQRSATPEITTLLGTQQQVTEAEQTINTARQRVQEAPETATFTTSEGEEISRSEALDRISRAELDVEGVQSTLDAQFRAEQVEQQRRQERQERGRIGDVIARDLTPLQRQIDQAETEGPVDEFGRELTQTGVFIQQEGEDTSEFLSDLVTEDTGPVDPLETAATPQGQLLGATEEAITGDRETTRQARESLLQGTLTAGTQLIGLTTQAAGGITRTGVIAREEGVTEAAKLPVQGTQSFVGAAAQQAREDPVEFVGQEAGEEIGEAAVFGTLTGGTGLILAGTPTPELTPEATPEAVGKIDPEQTFIDQGSTVLGRAENQEMGLQPEDVPDLEQLPFLGEQRGRGRGRELQFDEPFEQAQRRGGRGRERTIPQFEQGTREPNQRTQGPPEGLRPEDLEVLEQSTGTEVVGVETNEQGRVTQAVLRDPRTGEERRVRIAPEDIDPTKADSFLDLGPRKGRRKGETAGIPLVKEKDTTGKDVEADTPSQGLSEEFGVEPFDPTTETDVPTIDQTPTQRTPQTRETEAEGEAETSLEATIQGSRTVTPQPEDVVAGQEPVPKEVEDIQLERKVQQEPFITPSPEPETEPQPEPTLEISPEITPEPTPELRPEPTTTFTPEGERETTRTDDLRATETGGRGFEFAPSIDAIITGQTVTEERARETGLFDEEFTGTETRPVVIEENGDDELQDLFNF